MMAASPRRGNLEWISRLSSAFESFTVNSRPPMTFSTCACVACLKKCICSSFSKIQYFLDHMSYGFFLKPVLNLLSCLLFLILFAMNKGKSSFHFSFLQVFDLNYFCSFVISRLKSQSQIQPLKNMMFSGYFHYCLKELPVYPCLLGV